jgi:hypothetical protein
MSKVNLRVVDPNVKRNEAPKIPGAFQSSAEAEWRGWSVNLETIADLQAVAERTGSKLIVEFAPRTDDYYKPTLTRKLSDHEKKASWAKLAEEDGAQEVRELCGDALLGIEKPEQPEQPSDVEMNGNNEQQMLRIRDIRAMSRASLAFNHMKGSGIDDNFWPAVKDRLARLRENVPALLDLDNEVGQFVAWLDMNGLDKNKFAHQLFRSFVMASLADDKVG